ncbi:MAG: hypothetical protein IJA69_00795 [Clostridia bacterium]|nr:hypothetical protein [Clostridia bacterium]
MLFKNKKNLSKITIEKYMEYLKAEAEGKYNPELATQNVLSKSYAKRIYNALHFMKENNLLASSGELLDIIKTNGKLVDAKNVFGKNTKHDFVIQLNLSPDAQKRLESLEYKLLLVPTNIQEDKNSENVR